MSAIPNVRLKIYPRVSPAETESKIKVSRSYIPFFDRVLFTTYAKKIMNGYPESQNASASEGNGFSIPSPSWKYVHVNSADVHSTRPIVRERHA
jgi:hypothetical protein